MEFFKPGTRYNFLSIAKPLVTTSVVLVLVSWGLVAFKGLNFGIDFAGGTEALLSFKKNMDVGELRESVTETGLDLPEVVTYGLVDEGRYFIRSRTQSLLSEDDKNRIKAAIVAKFGEPELWMRLTNQEKKFGFASRRRRKTRNCRQCWIVLASKTGALVARPSPITPFTCFAFQAFVTGLYPR